MAFDPTKYEGAGVDELETGANMPLIRVLQDNSPQINPRKEEHVPGSEAGDLFFNKTKSVIPRPLEFVPVACKSVYVEWVPRNQGGGLVGTHELSIAKDPKYRKEGHKEFLGNNELKYTTYWCITALVNGEWIPAILALSSTGLTVSRKLAGDIASFRYENSKIPATIFARKFKLSTVLEKNKADEEYFNFKVSEPTVLDFVKDEELLNLCAEARETAIAELPSPESTKQIAQSKIEEQPY